MLKVDCCPWSFQIPEAELLSEKGFRKVTQLARFKANLDIRLFSLNQCSRGPDCMPAELPSGSPLLPYIVISASMYINTHGRKYRKLDRLCPYVDTACRGWD